MVSMMILISSCEKKTTPQKIENEQNLEKKNHGLEFMKAI